jgi:hypothetical protein
MIKLIKTKDRDTEEEIDIYYVIMKMHGIKVSRKSVAVWLNLMKEVLEKK